MEEDLNTPALWSVDMIKDRRDNGFQWEELQCQTLEGRNPTPLYFSTSTLSFLTPGHLAEHSTVLPQSCARFLFYWSPNYLIWRGKRKRKEKVWCSLQPLVLFCKNLKMASSQKINRDGLKTQRWPLSFCFACSFPITGGQIHIGATHST